MTRTTSLAVVKPEPSTAFQLEQAVKDSEREWIAKRRLMQQQIAGEAKAIAYRLVKQAMRDLRTDSE